MSERIRWTNDEWDHVARRISNYLIENPGATLVSAYKNINDTLPADRRRVMTALVQFDPILDKIKEFMKQKTETKTPPPEIQIIDRVVHTKLNIGDVSLEELYTEIHRRQLKPLIDDLAEQAASKVISCIKSGTASFEKDDDPKPRERLKKVLIVGLLPEQVNIIGKHFDGIYEMRFHKQGTNGLKTLSSNSDQAVLMTKFVSHNQCDIVKESGVPFLYCDGGITKLKKILEADFMADA